MRKYFSHEPSGNTFAYFLADIMIHGFIVLNGGELIQ